jgi:hypothetical protein
MNKLTYRAGANGEQIFARSVPDYICALVLAANTEKTLAVPEGAKTAFFSANADFFCRVGESAIEVPAAHVEDGTAPELNPNGYAVEEGQTLRFIASAACKVTVTFYS